MNQFNKELQEFIGAKGNGKDAAAILKIQEKLFNTCCLGMSGVEDEDNIYVKIELNALQQIQKIEIGDGAVKSGAKVTAALVKAAYDKALEEIRMTLQKEMYGEPLYLDKEVHHTSPA